jgi:hypothetical protein
MRTKLSPRNRAEIWTYVSVDWAKLRLRSEVRTRDRYQRVLYQSDGISARLNGNKGKEQYLARNLLARLVGAAKRFRGIDSAKTLSDWLELNMNLYNK